MVIAEPVTAIGDREATQHGGTPGHTGRLEQLEGLYANRRFDPFGRQGEGVLPELGHRPVPMDARDHESIGSPKPRPARVRSPSPRVQVVAVRPTRLLK